MRFFYRNNVVRDCGISAPPLLEEGTVVMFVGKSFLVTALKMPH
jgi:hypothetical protein